MSIEVDGLAADFDSRMVEDSAFFDVSSLRGVACMGIPLFLNRGERR